MTEMLRPWYYSNERCPAMSGGIAFGVKPGQLAGAPGFFPFLNTVRHLLSSRFAPERLFATLGEFHDTQNDSEHSTKRDDSLYVHWQRLLIESRRPSMAKHRADYSVVAR